MTTDMGSSVFPFYVIQFLKVATSLELAPSRVLALSQFCTTADSAQPPFGATNSENTRTIVTSSNDASAYQVYHRSCMWATIYLTQETIPTIAALTSKRTNLSPFTKGCRERGASMRICCNFSRGSTPTTSETLEKREC